MFDDQVKRVSHAWNSLTELSRVCSRFDITATVRGYTSVRTLCQPETVQLVRDELVLVLAQLPIF